MNESNYHTLIAKSARILEILELIDRAAVTNASVLLTGESGVGKELFAERIHLRSLRKNAPFVRVNCASLPEGLLESELFGHVKGAFTDAVKDREGRFETANGGTLFLDEIGDMPFPLQAKLLRVIQEKKIEKVGSGVSINADVRIITATNKDLETQIQNGFFRQDLYYRLNVLPIHIPPLRQRHDDIMELAEYFLKIYSEKTGKEFSGFTGEARLSLLSYSWPGNIRELQNSIERACVTAKGKVIGEADLFLKQNAGLAADGGAKKLKPAVNAFKANFIRKTLEECDWNQTEAAKVLAIQRTYLSKLLKEFNIMGDAKNGK